MITLDEVTSKDGTTITYDRLGDGPGLVVLHGVMQTGHSNIELAQALASDFTCYVPDRRGRGRSGPYGPDYGLQREVEDLDALLEATGAQHVVGVSSGAIVTLRTALARPALRKVVAFEPPLDLGGSYPAGWLDRFDGELAAGRIPAALVTGMLATRLGPPVFHVMPRALLELLTAMMLKKQEKAAGAGEPTYRELAPTLHYDGQVVAETAADLDVYRSVQAEVLLLGGTKSPAHLRSVLTALEGVLPRARRVDMAGLDHSATSNAAMRGKPERVAEEIRRFLTAP
ncbi:pimeloyl-ACP methyl ester carboxylesterase [Nonomuraea polychroma]|uniref:Pimeloyl-ACP methyl ester carboxylesterase n=1 Tax=Nonomuraea polychroma TaxID=46176 RepID=A0A438M7W5_9ACTN|nr:alpha/beta hydrolase [Nonomuraea polychroma]RVX41802.1 pimeloyl-ACP methyl ester carboxylesterase [Nonomuraea polychroma]